MNTHKPKTFAEFCESLASIGDTIETDVQNPYPAILRMTLDTPESCAFGNDLIMSGRWRKSNAVKTKDA